MLRRRTSRRPQDLEQSPERQVTGPTDGVTGAGLQGIVAFNPLIAPTYTPGQVVLYNGSSYVVNTPSPAGIPDTSADYTLLAAAGSTVDRTNRRYRSRIDRIDSF